MGKPTGFLEVNRELPLKRSPRERIQDYLEIEPKPEVKHAQKQASRCMDCGIPFCHSGCPLGNIIPEFNDAVYQQNWQLAYDVLLSTNNFPEFTGRICPAPCEASCVLGLQNSPVTIEYIEKSIIEIAYENGWVVPKPPAFRTGKKVAVVGSGPSGLAAADQLNKAGHEVTVFERAEVIGGLLRLGIPDFKLEKKIVERKIQVLEAEGIKFLTNAYVGKNVPVEKLKNEFDAIVLCMGSTIPRDLPATGRDAKGVHFAMDFLTHQNRKITSGEPVEEKWHAKDKHVVVIGGGDTGSDCVGTSIRQGAASVTQIEIMPKPPKDRTAQMPWPNWPTILRTSTSHEEGCSRHWSIVTKEFLKDKQGNLRALRIADVAWDKTGFKEVPNTEREIPCEFALLAMGFLHTQHEGLLQQLEIEKDERGNARCTNYQSSVPGIFCAGDMRRGQSLVVWAIQEGRQAASAVHQYLMEGR